MKQRHRGDELAIDFALVALAASGLVWLLLVGLAIGGCGTTGQIVVADGKAFAARALRVSVEEWEKYDHDKKRRVKDAAPKGQKEAAVQAYIDNEQMPARAAIDKAAGALARLDAVTDPANLAELEARVNELLRVLAPLHLPGVPPPAATSPGGAP